MRPGSKRESAELLAAIPETQPAEPGAELGLSRTVRAIRIILWNSQGMGVSFPHSFLVFGTAYIVPRSGRASERAEGKNDEGIRHVGIGDFSHLQRAEQRPAQSQRWSSARSSFAL